MVMETPSPRSVGREFVRQYYTLMHEAPKHLHRFYSHDSSFVHGGVDKPGEEPQAPVVGQQDIHNKIMTLNFDNCHAKIRQVDSQATVGPAVVVQVTGELSNNGQPMRRFMQTFVLVSQSSKHYYVHNDIFRYQDEVFHDNDTEPDVSDDAADSEPELIDGGLASDVVVVVADTGSPQQTYFEASTSPQQQEMPLSNGAVHLEERSESPSPAPSVNEDEKLDEPAVQEEATDVEERKEEEEEVEEEEEEPDVVQPPPQPKAAVNNVPFSWALLTKKQASSAAAAPPPAASVQSAAPPAAATAPKPQRVPRPAVVDRPALGRGSGRPPVDGGDESRMLPQRYGDQHQVFVGQLPGSCTERELRDCFEAYGPVHQLTIHRRYGTSFAFVVFTETSSVQKVLENPVFANIDGREQALKIQEKKANYPRGPSMRGGRGGSRGGMDGRPNSGGVGRMGGGGRGMGPRR